MYGLQKTSTKLPTPLRNALRHRRFWNYGWACFGRAYSGGDQFDQAFWARRSNRVYNFFDRDKTGRLFKSTNK